MVARVIEHVPGAAVDDDSTIARAVKVSPFEQKNIMGFTTPKIRKLGVPAQSSTHSGPGFGLRTQICSRTRWSNRESATPRGHSHLSGNPKLDSSPKSHESDKRCQPPNPDPPYQTRLDELCMVLDGFWMIHAFWMDGPGITN